MNYNYDVIYIDPPYNTESAYTDGNNSANDKENISASKFIYRDKFSRNGWLNMMNERLCLAKKLLKDDGVIFVSIDDNEQAYLKVLMDEIFGEENFITNLIWRNKNTGGGSDKANIEIETEYIILYAKNKNNVLYNSIPIDKNSFNLSDEFLEERGKYKLTDLDHVCSKSSFKYSSSLDYEIIAPDGTSFSNYRNKIIPKSYAYTLGLDTFLSQKKLGFIEIQQKFDKKNNLYYWKAYRKIYQKVKFDNNKNEIIKRERGNNFNNIIFDNNITTSAGKRNLISILNNKDFSFPKPHKLIMYLVNLIPNKNARVLDFFGGSGTTGHAVLELNKEDGGNRTYTIVTNNENNIADDVTYERLYRINNGIGTNNETFKWSEKNEPYKQNLDVFNLEYSSIDINDHNDNTQILKDMLRESLKHFGIESVSEEELLNNLSNLYSLEREDNETN
ncbi:site-specific DNA-methyltransferase [Ureaplasma sp. ES3154-GEN]|uniref:site-specific DNA-methyltransferase n=1 Tax=Ureaplasma sp. ES3154-GEN TaxID=2984844 RepID=UPI0021E75D53|nr:site-specific DNA-methyltransferase [Ureaplasma sp. ES3154-GEN]MCV3743699.1 site-specific DNA-methyltransferase [Ureaplasma sp. ES3154-GEN]